MFTTFIIFTGHNTKKPSLLGFKEVLVGELRAFQYRRL